MLASAEWYYRGSFFPSIVDVDECERQAVDQYISNVGADVPCPWSINRPWTRYIGGDKSRPYGLQSYHLRDDRFDTFWAAQMQPDWSLPRLKNKGKREKGTTSSLKGDEL